MRTICEVLVHALNGLPKSISSEAVLSVTIVNVSLNRRRFVMKVFLRDAANQDGLWLRVLVLRNEPSAMFKRVAMEVS